MGPGTAHSAVCGRLSYFLGWRGPCICVDTACSSSLVALHLAVQRPARPGVRASRSAAGSTSSTTRAHIIVLAGEHAARPTGAARPSTSAPTATRASEGCAVLVLKRLSDAKRDGDRVLALVRGSAVRQDGESAGLTVPNGTAQERTHARRAGQRDARARRHPVRGGARHRHAARRPDRDGRDRRGVRGVAQRAAPILVGSVKTNIGHMEAAAGVGGIVKTVLQLRDGVDLSAHPPRNAVAPHPLGSLSGDRADRSPAVAGAAPPRAGEFVRLHRNDRDGRAGAGAAGRRPRPWPRRTTRRYVFTLVREAVQALAQAAARRYRRLLDANPDLAARRSVLHHQRRPGALSVTCGSRLPSARAGAGRACSTRSSRTLTRNAPAGGVPRPQASPSSSPARARSTPAWAPGSTRSTRRSPRARRLRRALCAASSAARSAS